MERATLIDALTEAQVQQKLLSNAIQSMRNLHDYKYRPFDYSDLLASLENQLQSTTHFIDDRQT